MRSIISCTRIKAAFHFLQQSALPMPNGLPSADTPPVLAPHDAQADGLRVDLDGFEGPLDLLLDLARRNKLDLTVMALRPLVEQYLAYIAKAQALKLDLAGDYLVMAAWLTLLKSRALLPKPAADHPDPEQALEALAAKLQAAEQARTLGAHLRTLFEAQGETYPRGQGIPLAAERAPFWQVDTLDLARAYLALRLRKVEPHYTPPMRRVLAIPEARERLITALRRQDASAPDAVWHPLTDLIQFHAQHLETPDETTPISRLASSLVAALELTRENRIALRQTTPFAPIYMRQTSFTPPEPANAALLQKPEPPKLDPSTP